MPLGLGLKNFSGFDFRPKNKNLASPQEIARIFGGQGRAYPTKSSVSRETRQGDGSGENRSFFYIILLKEKRTPWRPLSLPQSSFTDANQGIRPRDPISADLLKLANN